MDERQFHEVANLFPLMQGDEYAALRDDIAANGLREPIWLHPDGSIIDGRNRYRACRELDIEPECRTWNCSGSLVAFVVSLNLHRRHLKPEQAVAVAVDMLTWLEAEAKERQIAAGVAGAEYGALGGRGNKKPLVANLPQGVSTNGNGSKASKKKSAPKSRDVAAKTTGVSPRNVQDGKKIKEKAPELFEKMREGEMTTAAAMKEVKRRDKQAERKETTVTVDDPGVWHGDMRELGRRIADNSVDLILTDPPYPGEFLPLFSDLSTLAARVLKPGGLCLVYSGQIFLPEVISRLSESLEYVWTFAIRHGGGNQRIFKMNVNTGWKPVLAFYKPPLSVWWDSFIDITSGTREKDLHEWQQAESEAAYFIEHLSLPGQVVVDPFCGSGTVLSAAKKLGRQYLGIEAAEEHVQHARERLA